MINSETNGNPPPLRELEQMIAKILQDIDIKKAELITDIAERAGGGPEAILVSVNILLNMNLDLKKLRELRAKSSEEIRKDLGLSN